MLSSSGLRDCVELLIDIDGVLNIGGNGGNGSSTKQATMPLHENCFLGRRGKPHSCHLGFIVQTHSAFQGATGGTSRFALLHCYIVTLLHVTLRISHFSRLLTLQRI